MAVTVCTAVTKRASEGPCVALVDWARYVGLRCWGDPDDHCKDHGEGTCTIDHAHHAYLGPVVERCGLEAREHCTPQHLRLGEHGHHPFTVKAAS